MSTRSQEVMAQLKAQRFAVAKAYLLGLERRAEIVPKSADIILDRLKEHGGTPNEVLRAAVEYVHGTKHPITNAHEPGPGDAFRDPAHKHDGLPIRQVVDALIAGGYVGKAWADHVFREFASDVAGRSMGEVAEAIADRLDLPENHAVLVDPPPPPGDSGKVLRTLSAMREAIRPDIDLRRLAADWRMWGLEPQEKLARMCRDAILGRPDLRAYEGVVIDGTDPIFRPDPEEQKLVEATAAGIRMNYHRSLG